MGSTEETLTQNEKGRKALARWRAAIGQNPYIADPEFQHSVAFHLTANLNR